MRQRKIRALSIVIVLAACVFAFSNAALARGEYTADNVRLGGTAGIYRDTEVDNNNFTAWATDAGEAYSGLNIHSKPNKSVKLSVSVKADDTTGITYRWEVRQYDHQTGEMSHQTVVENAASATYTVKITGRANYTCYVTDRYGTTREVYFYIYVDNNFDAWATLSDVHGQDWIMIVDFNGSAEMSVTADATDTTGITYTWFFMRYNETHNYWGNELIENAVSATYTADGITEKAKYACKVRDRYGNEKWVYFHIFISNNLEAWATDSTDRSSVYYCYVIPNTSAKLSVSVDATDTTGITYQWHREQTGASYYTEIEGATSPTYTTGQIKTEEEYYCKVTDKYGTQKGVWIHVIPWEDTVAFQTTLNMMDYTGVFVYIHIPEGENASDYTVVTTPNNSMYDGIGAQNAALSSFGYTNRDLDGQSVRFYRVDAIHVASTELTDTVVVTLKKNGMTVHEETYSVASIIAERLASGTLDATRAKLNRALLQYGRYAQIRFDHKTEDLPPEDPDAPALTRIPDSYAAKGDPTNFGSYIAKFEAKIEMADAVSMNIYLTAASGYTINDFDITVIDANGKAYAEVTTPRMLNGKIFLKVKDIASFEMSNEFRIVVKLKKDPSKTATWTRSLITCAYENYQAATTDARRNLMLSLYQYYLAAVERFVNNASN